MYLDKRMNKVRRDISRTLNLLEKIERDEIPYNVYVASMVDDIYSDLMTVLFNIEKMYLM